MCNCLSLIQLFNFIFIFEKKILQYFPFSYFLEFNVAAL